MRILFVGDVFGVPGRRALEDRLPGLRDELNVDFCIVNGENAADGAGITGKHADRMLAAGAVVQPRPGAPAAKFAGRMTRSARPR